LTITAFECFGPIVRDFNASHAWNPDWDGHAASTSCGGLRPWDLSGIANLYLIWVRKPLEVRTLWLSAAWQGTILAGFWVACLLTPVYEGRVTMPNIHMYIFGIDENVVVFTLLSAVLAAAVTLLATRLRDTTAR
jgi:hypothetical protein